MQRAELLSNPFALMLNPAEVVLAVERSERLERLQRRVCRPLDALTPARPMDELITASGQEALDGLVDD